MVLKDKNEQNLLQKKGFLPIVSPGCKTLILGSFPSVKSREVLFYYGNPRNRFWKVLSDIFGENCGDRAEDKINFLLKNNVALWDIACFCSIDGSKDNSITNVKIVDLNEIFGVCKIQKILFNGKKSYELYLSKYSDLKMQVHVLPSTSPANPKFDIELWKKALN